MTPYTTTQAISDTRHKLLDNFSAKLATVMRSDHELSGYPLGSIVPYVLDDDGMPIMLISWLAEHTKNIAQDSRATLLLNDPTVIHDVQSAWRIAVIGDISAIPEDKIEPIAKRYYEHFPSTAGYHQVMDFSFHRFQIRKAHAVMGFGKISWLSGSDIFDKSPFDASTQQSIKSHMNDDHQSAMRRYLAAKGLEVGDHERVEMVAVNQYGITLLYDARPYHIAFPEVAVTPDAVRRQLVKLAHPE